MKSRFKAAMVSGLAVILCLPAFAAETPAMGELTNQLDRVGYSVGAYVANSFIKPYEMELNPDMVAQAIRDVLKTNALRMTEQQVMETLRAQDQLRVAKREQRRIKLAEKNRQEGEAFLAANRQKAGIKTHPVRISETGSAEMQYKVLKDGAGESPHPTDAVIFNLKGTLISGKDCENSLNQKNILGQIRQVGLREALQMMKPGAKWQLFLPSTLAYGDFAGGPAVEPGSTMIYEIDLVSVETPLPVTSDIVMVPAADALKAGSNIAVIKAEDAANYARSNAAAKKP